MNIELDVGKLRILLMAARLHAGEEAHALHLGRAAHLAFAGDRCRIIGSNIDGSRAAGCDGASLKLKICGAGTAGCERADELDGDRANAGVALGRDLDCDRSDASIARVCRGWLSGLRGWW
jgi:hypothetical protein